VIPERVPRRLSASQRRVVGEIVRLLLPAHPSLEPAEAAGVHSAVTDFVEVEIGALPSFIRVPYRFTITAFRLLPALRWARPFEALPPAAQRSALSLWSGSPIGPMRDFVKLIRGCALLAYFDHPQVARRLPGARPAPPRSAGPSHAV
jgi:hypothetical protein